jgi:hypothetical protein
MKIQLLSDEMASRIAAGEVRAARDERLDALFKHSTGKEHSPPAAVATYADIGAHADDRPLSGAARVRLAKLNNVIHVEINDHVVILRWIRARRIITPLA